MRKFCSGAISLAATIFMIVFELWFRVKYTDPSISPNTQTLISISCGFFIGVVGMSLYLYLSNSHGWKRE